MSGAGGGRGVLGSGDDVGGGSGAGERDGDGGGTVVVVLFWVVLVGVLVGVVEVVLVGLVGMLLVVLVGVVLFEMSQTSGSQMEGLQVIQTCNREVMKDE